MTSTAYPYYCPYLKKDGFTCGRKCLRQAGCSTHYNRLPRGPCVRCGLPTVVSVSGEYLCTRKHPAVPSYTCPYMLNSGELCGTRCRHPNGCGVHRARMPRGQCLVCGKVTSNLALGRRLCSVHAAQRAADHQDHQDHQAPPPQDCSDLIDEIMTWGW